MNEVPVRWSAASVRTEWVDAADDPREAVTSSTDERGILVDYLGRYRLTLEMKCADLDAEQLARRSVPPSTLSLLGLIRHMAEVERYWFRQVMAGHDVPRRYCASDSPDADFDGAIADIALVRQAWEAWREEIEFADDFLARTDDLATLGTRRDGTQLPLREVLVHMVEEYARHCGHADLLRERIDGRIGQ